MANFPNSPIQVTQPILPPAASTGTGFGGGFKRFVFGLLLMVFLQIIGLVLLDRKNLDPMIVIYSIVGCAGVQGLLLLAWLNYTAARLTGVRGTTVSGALASAVLALMLVAGGWWGGTYLQGMKLPDQITPYAWAIPAAVAGIGYWIAVKLGFKAGVLRTFLTMLIGFGLPTAGVLAAGQYVPQMAVDDTEPLRAKVRQGIAFLNMYNLDYVLRQHRAENHDALPSDLSPYLPTRTTQSASQPGTVPEIPQVTTLWPFARVREGMELLKDWNGKLVGDYDLLNADLLVAYCDPQKITPAASQPAEIEQLGRWVLFTSGKVAWKNAEEYNKLRDNTHSLLEKGPVRPAPPANVPATPIKDRPVPVPAPQNTPTGSSGGKSDPGELFPQVPGK